MLRCHLMRSLHVFCLLCLRLEDLEKLRAALDEAEVEGVELSEARDLERRLRAKEVLQRAEGEEELRRALQEAREVLGESEMSDFVEKLKQMEEQRTLEEAKEEAKALLRAAEDVEALRSAIDMARRAGLNVEPDMQRLRDLEALPKEDITDMYSPLAILQFQFTSIHDHYRSCAALASN